ncbi:hypothetical protein GPECTOR_43g856 [Gonium pectorale]|uniref:Uncharacterized protein n=1 Tax=Gonium pectorale TaxID=33097 RepID=A0A150GAP3_GONPE|nr:hypothetical protein GPECTOR_43g856 [Gonium pectorale]|eukprot:KXZ46420.1 hypothetical protein GPECTOR_43g856 [Gonium pectorale]
MAAPFSADGVAVKYGVPVAVVSLTWFAMALIIAKFTIKGDARNFFVCNRTLPLYVVTCALMAQGLDSNATLGNVLSAFKYGFWDGAVLPLGLGISLIINSFLLAGPINRMGLLTLPELYGRKYGGLVEVMASCICITSFIFLLAGNLVGISLVLRFCFGFPKGASLAISGVVLALYSGSGGLFSVALTDLPQVLGGFTAFLATTIYMFKHDPNPHVPPVSLGFAYDLGNNVTARTPGYTGPVDCMDPITGLPTCDNYAYPVGDKLIYPKSMESTDAYAPFPNAILARCMAAKSATVARLGNLFGGILIIAVGVPFGLLAGHARKYFGPDSQYAQFEADTCSLPLGLPTCAQWLNDDKFVLFKLLWAHVPRYGTKEENLLWVARIFHVPMTLVSCFVAAWSYNPSYLLVVAFDIVLCGCFVPLVAAVYMGKRASPNAGILSTFLGSVLRITLEFTLPKDGSLVASGAYALWYGRGLAGLPSFMEISPPEQQATAGVWDPSKDTCEQPRMEDWTGLDSLVCPVVSLIVFMAVVAFEHFWPGRDILFFIPKTWRATQPLYQLDAEYVDSSRTPALGGDVAFKGTIPAGGHLKDDSSAHGNSPRNGSGGSAVSPIMDDPIAKEVQLGGWVWVWAL